MENDLIKQGHELFNAKQYTEAIQKLNEALDTTNDPQQQVDVQFLLGRCYLEQALQTGNTALFDKARQHHQEQLALAKKLDGDTGIKEQANVQFWLGYCYFNQALQTGNAALFDDARRYFQEQLECTKKLSGDKGIEKQANAQSWLGYCYFKQALQTGNAALFDDARRYFQEWLESAEKLGGDKDIEEQAKAQFWLGRCYFEQALQTDNAISFDKAYKHFQAQLTQAEQLEKLNSDKGIEKQANAQVWLGRCYLKQAKQNQGNIEQSEDYLSEAEKCFDEVSKLVEKSKDKSFKKQVISKLRRDFRELDFAKGNYDNYFKSKQEHIQQKLSKNKKINGCLKETLLRFWRY